MAGINKGGSPQVFVGGSTKSKRRLHIGMPKKDENFVSKKLIVGIVLFIVLIAIALTSAIIVSNHNKANKTQRNSQIYTQAFEAANKLYISGQTTQAKQTLQKLLGDKSISLTQEQRTAIFNQLSIISNELGNKSAALNYQRVASSGAGQKTFNDYYGYAQTCESANDKDCAIKNYELALTALQDKSNRPADWKNYDYYIRNKIKSLGGS